MEKLVRQVSKLVKFKPGIKFNEKWNLTDEQKENVSKEIVAIIHKRAQQAAIALEKRRIREEDKLIGEAVYLLNRMDALPDV